MAHKIPIQIPHKKTLCYLKYGNVCEELVYTANSGIITGGHYYYVYATSHLSNTLTDILYLSINKKKCVASHGHCIAKNIKPIALPGKIGKICTIFHGILLITFELFKYRPDHILCVRTHGLFLYYLYARINSIPFTMSIHTDLEVGRKLDKLIERYVLKKSASIICHGPYLFKQAKQIIGNSKKILEYNASTEDILKIAPTPKLSNKLSHLPKNIRIITYIGRMEADKGVMDLYNAFKKLPKDGHSYHLCFAGSGDITALVTKMINLDNMGHKIHVLGAINRNEVAELLKKTWVAVTPTRKEFPEGRCMAAMEALSLGIPLIAPEFGPFEHLIKDRVNGLFYKANSVDDLHNKLKLMQNTELRNTLAQGTAKYSKNRNTNRLSYGDAVKQSVEKGNG